MKRRFVSNIEAAPSDHSAEPPANSRAEARSNIFVVAVVYSETGSGPVRIRNMSPGGALIEGAALPPAKARIRLNRGSLGACGHVAWNRDGRAGISFDSPASVSDWLPHGNRATCQQHVDEIVHNVKSGAASDPTIGKDLADRLLRVQVSLKGVGEELANDLHLSDRHLRNAQLIDGAVRELEALAALLVSRGKGQF